MLEHLKSHLKGKVAILAIGNTLRSDDGLGPVFVRRIKDKVAFKVFDAGTTPENYFGKIIKEAPDNLIIIDAVDFGGKPGEIAIIEGNALKTTNLFVTHNASISLVTSYLQNNLAADIISLVIQPKTIAFGDKLSQEVTEALDKLEGWFCEAGKEEG